jgi:cell division protein FtsW
MSVDYRRFKKFVKPLLLLSFLLLILVLVPGIGREVAGARRWFRLKFISFQPSELANLGLILYIADFIARKGNLIRTFWRGFLPPMVVLGIIIIFILIQPDLGTAMALGIVVFIMLFVAGVRVSYLLSIILLSLPLLYVLIFNVPYRRMRIMTFLNPWLDPKGSGFQIIQSQIALGSGGIFGVGLGIPSKNYFIYPQHIQTLFFP